MENIFTNSLLLFSVGTDKNQVRTEEKYVRIKSEYLELYSDEKCTFRSYVLINYRNVYSTEIKLICKFWLRHCQSSLLRLSATLSSALYISQELCHSSCRKML